MGAAYATADDASVARVRIAARQDLSHAPGGLLSPTHPPPTGAPADQRICAAGDQCGGGGATWYREKPSARESRPCADRTGDYGAVAIDGPPGPAPVSGQTGFTLAAGVSETRPLCVSDFG